MTAASAGPEGTPDKGVLSVGQENPDLQLVAGIERWYSVAEAAVFFERSTQWLYDRIKKNKLTYQDGTVIRPHQNVSHVEDEHGQLRPVYGSMRFNKPLIEEIAQSLYRVGTVKMPELKIIYQRVRDAELGSFEPSAVYDDE